MNGIHASLDGKGLGQRKSLAVSFQGEGVNLKSDSGILAWYFWKKANRKFPHLIKVENLKKMLNLGKFIKEGFCYLK